MLTRIKHFFIGKPRNPDDQELFHKISLIAFFAWVGLGADPLSSSCYGPQEAFLALSNHHYLAIFVALATAVTIFVISSSYSQIIELFPSGGGGYLVASKLLSPATGMVSGCALLVDYVLTITLSISSGADAIFSFLPPSFYPYRIEFAVFALLLLTVLNLRGVKESVVTLMPIFIVFLLTHVFVIGYAIISHLGNFPMVLQGTVSDINSASSEMGVFGMLFIIMRAYSMGAGTYTGIEAVSNGLPILREPRVQTGKKTMKYMAYSLAFMVLGLMLAYMLYGIQLVPGKTLNAVLFEQLTANWGAQASYVFVLLTLLSEAAILYVAAQAGFLDGPRVLSNMAIDRWMPSQFSILSDRLVTQNGILLMGGLSLVLMLITGGAVKYLIVLYSINVFITFVLSQLGMVRYWWTSRKKITDWFKKFAVNGIGLALTSFILVSVVVVKFFEGGWITIIITGSIVAVAASIKRHYNKTANILKRLDSLVLAAGKINETAPYVIIPEIKFDPNGKTAAILVNGYNGLGLHTLFGIIRTFGNVFKNFVFVQAGIIDAGNFKGKAEIEHLKEHIDKEVSYYVNYMRNKGYYAEGFTATGIDIIDEISELVPKVFEKFPQSVFFGGQLVFPEDKFLTRFLHNYTVFAIQRKLYHQGIPIVMLPIRVESEKILPFKGSGNLQSPK